MRSSSSEVWARYRYVLHSTIVGPSPRRAWRTAERTAPYTSSGSFPSTMTPPNPYEWARAATSSTADSDDIGTEIA